MLQGKLVAQPEEQKTNVHFYKLVVKQQVAIIYPE